MPATAICFVLLSCFLIHLQLAFSSSWIITIMKKNLQLVFNMFAGVLYLLYPTIGLLAEVCLSNFKMIKCSFAAWFLSTFLMLITAIFSMTISPYFSEGLLQSTCGVLFLVTGLAGLGMYEANAIQFGMDQMLEASSEQLSSFIHWYFWCVHTGPLIVFYCVLCIIVYIKNCKFTYSLFGNFAFGLVVLIISVIQVISCMIGYLYMKWSNSRLSCIEQRSRNSLQIIYKVLKYAYQHKFPERRSAFTYWENHTPSRIDLGKHKYGGPFTYEQVEDVKTFFRLLLLIMSLFGFQLSGDGYSLTFYTMNTSGCFTIAPLAMIITNPLHIPFLFVSVGVPIFELYKKKFVQYLPDMLTRLRIGLFLSLVNEAVQVVCALLMPQRDFNCPQASSAISVLAKCLYANSNIVRNDSCQHFCSDEPINSPLVYILILPFMLHGVSYLLIFMTILEFICAQSPSSFKGLLIGLWYSQLSIKYMIINTLDTYPPYLDSVHWNIYHGIKGIGIFLSIIFFSIVCKYYRYRERNEVVNEQAIIEEQFERELLNNSGSGSASDPNDK